MRVIRHIWVQAALDARERGYTNVARVTVRGRIARSACPTRPELRLRFHPQHHDFDIYDIRPFLHQTLPISIGSAKHIATTSRIEVYIFLGNRHCCSLPDAPQTNGLYISRRRSGYRNTLPMGNTLADHAQKASCFAYDGGQLRRHSAVMARVCAPLP